MQNQDWPLVANVITSTLNGDNLTPDARVLLDNAFKADFNRYSAILDGVKSSKDSTEPDEADG